MSMTDPVADLLTRIRNGQTAGKPQVSLASSKIKTAIVRVLKDEGYVADFHIAAEDGKPKLTIDLKYFEGRPVIDRLERPGRAAEGPRRSGNGHRFHAPGRDDRPPGPSNRPGRRSSLHRGLTGRASVKGSRQCLA
jgi:hypothetical protein